ncbi:MAG: LUD domain-containing protein [Thermonemataceae bacterium]|nr:LUD domain-containing protein [Thermonemataceae bacterium]
MKEKNNIIERIKNALKNKSEQRSPKPDFQADVYTHKSIDDLAILFAENLRAIQGNFCFCENENAFLLNLLALIRQKNAKEVFVWEKDLQAIIDLTDLAYRKDDEGFEEALIGISTCEYLIAKEGGVLVSSKQKSGRRLNIYPPIHIVVAFSSQIVYDVSTALQKTREKYKGKLPSMLSFINGPSRTADIEKTLVLGAHGPKELHVFLIDDIM